MPVFDKIFDNEGRYKHGKMYMLCSMPVFDKIFDNEGGYKRGKMYM